MQTPTKRKKRIGTRPKKRVAHRPSSNRVTSKGKAATVVWGAELEEQYFSKVPKVMFYLGRYDGQTARSLKPRHFLLVLALAARKFQDKPIRVYWETLAMELGCRTDTVRLRDMGLLKIRQHRTRNREKENPGYRNDRNSFELTPFSELLLAADEKRKKERSERAAQRTTSSNSSENGE